MTKLSTNNVKNKQEKLYSFFIKFGTRIRFLESLNTNLASKFQIVDLIWRLKKFDKFSNFNSTIVGLLNENLVSKW